MNLSDTILSKIHKTTAIKLLLRNKDKHFFATKKNVYIMFTLIW